jgi:hypothetical protein
MFATAEEAAAMYVAANRELRGVSTSNSKPQSLEHQAIMLAADG